MASYVVHVYKGYFVGSFASSRGDGLHVGYAQICTERPKKETPPRVLEQVRSVGAYEDPERAVRAAEHQARAIIDSLAPNWDPFTNPGWMISR